MPEPIELGVSDFVALLNQTLEFAYPSVVITGELANLRVSRNRWVYFDLKDDTASVKFFGTVYQLPGPLEDGLLLKVRGQPRLHPLYGFSVNVQTIQPAGKGSIKKAAALLQAKLAAEGLFDEGRKRTLPYPPVRIGLVTSKQSAAYADFMKILEARWHGVDIQLIDVQVQGEASPAQITAALEQFNAEAHPPEVVILIRGGGSAEDLAAFSTEQVTRAVAASRVPTLVAVGHETDLSLAELAADRRASTPSNAAELLVPDRETVQAALLGTRSQLRHAGERHILSVRGELQQARQGLDHQLQLLLQHASLSVESQARLLEAFNPRAVLQRGYAIVRQGGRSLRDSSVLKPSDAVDIELSQGGFAATVTEVKHA
jgi:exodeoxyribonuclease VII large subunit